MRVKLIILFSLTAFLVVFISCSNSTSRQEPVQNIDKRELDKSLENVNRLMLQKESELINEYIEKNNLDVVRTGTGLRYQIIEQGDGDLIKKGDIVKLKASANSQTVQGFVSLIIPILGAILGFFLGGLLANKFSLNNVEMFQAFGVLLGLIFTSTVIFLLSKTILKFKKTEIVEVL